jgi:hypothetical protein
MEKQMTDTNRLLPKFLLGRIVATPGALRALEQANQNPFKFLQSHQAGDWGELCEEDKRRMIFRYGMVSESSAPIGLETK